MSLVSTLDSSSSSSSSGRGSNNSSSNNRAVGWKWGRRDMSSVQYRPDLGSISLNPPPSSPAPLPPPSPHLPSSSFLHRQTFPMNQHQHQHHPQPPPPPFPSSSSPPFDPFSSSLLSSLKLHSHHRHLLSRSLPLRLPLSPQESSSLGFPDPSPTALPHRFLQIEHNHSQSHSPRPRAPSQPPCAPSSSPSFYHADSCRAPAAALHRDLHFSDLPIVRGPAAFQSPLQTGSCSNGNGSSRSCIDLEDDGCRGNEESKRLKRTLEDLERELLGDDSEPASSVFERELPLISAEPPERDWTDVIEDLLSAESSSLPAQTVESASQVLLEQSTITCNSSRMEHSSAGTGQRIALSQQHAPAVQSLHPIVDATGQPKQLLRSCAQAIDEEDLELASSILTSLKQSVSIYGDPMQRLAAYMVDGLDAKIEFLRRGDGKALKFKDPSATEVHSAAQVLHQYCPFFKFGYIAANGAIAEALQNESKIHIIDLEIGQGNQWPLLIGALAGRPGGPPHVRLTGVGDPKSSTSPAGGLEGVGWRLKEMAQAARVPFEFNPVAVEASQVQRWMLESKAGEALAVNFAFQLHRMPDESVSTTNPRDRLLRMVKSLAPKVVTLVEREANTNTAPFVPRVGEAVSYFSAVFDSLDAVLPRDSRERVNAEQHWLARQVVNIVACEESERVERYEMAGKWRARMSMAGFRPYPISPSIKGSIKELLQQYSQNYKLRDESGALHLDWLDRGLIVASSWQ